MDGVGNAVIVLDCPFDGSPIDPICADVASDTTDNPVYLDWWGRAVAGIVGDAGRRTIVDEDFG